MTAFARDAYGNARRAMGVSRASYADDRSGPAGSLQAVRDGICVGDFHAARNHSAVLGRLHPRHHTRDAGSISSVCVHRVLFWNCFASSLRFSAVSLSSNANLVTKIYFPREIFPFSQIWSAWLISELGRRS